MSGSKKPFKPSFKELEKRTCSLLSARITPLANKCRIVTIILEIYLTAQLIRW